MLDIIVIGGGPVGSHTAYQLARMGHSVTVLEKRRRFGGSVCCTGIVSLECVQSFAIDDRLILRRVNSARLFSPSGNLLHLKRRESVACVIDRAGLDDFMADRAKREGAKFILGVDVQRVEVGDDRVKIRVNYAGQETFLEARVVVLATGSYSNLIGQSGQSSQDFVLGVQAEVESPGADEIEVYFGREIAPGFFAWLVPTLPGKALTGLLSRHNAGSYLRKLLSSLQTQGKITSVRVNMSYRRVMLKSGARTYGNRLLMVGSTAGQVKPITGGGIYFGLLAAEIAADTLHKALQQDDLSAGNLAGYEHEWKNQLGKDITAGTYVRDFFERLSDPQIDNIFRLATICGLQDSLQDDMLFDWHGKTMVRLMGRGIIARAVKKITVPFPMEILGNE
ncbi:MAG: NAD(P)/FAD-dependent oxidoreductase [Chloroflexota bacterium]